MTFPCWMFSTSATVNQSNKDLLVIDRIKCTSSSSASAPIWSSAQEAKRITLFFFFARISNELCFMGCEMKWYPLGGLDTQMCPKLSPPWVCVRVQRKQRRHLVLRAWIIIKLNLRYSAWSAEVCGSWIFGGCEKQWAGVSPFKEQSTQASTQAVCHFLQLVKILREKQPIINQQTRDFWYDKTTRPHAWTNSQSSPWINAFVY